MAINSLSDNHPLISAENSRIVNNLAAPKAATVESQRSNLFGTNNQIDNRLLVQSAIVNNPGGSGIINDPVVGRFSFVERNVTGPFNAPATNSAAPAQNDVAAIDAGHNGNAYRVTAPNADPNRTPVIFVNGINTDLVGARRTAAEVSRLTGAPVDLAYNAGSSATALGKTLAHFRVIARREAEAAVPSWLSGRARNAWIATDTNRRVAVAATSPEAPDWGKRNALHNPPTAQTTANMILEQLNNSSGQVNIVAYSQGGAITTEALRRLAGQGVDVSRVRVLTVGAAADRDDFPRGVHVSSFAHRTDGIAQYFGENRANFNTRAVWNQVLDRGGFTQHTNYFRGQGSGNAADPNAERLLQNWYNGNSFPFQLLNDVQTR